MIDEALQSKLSRCKNLPSPPGVATKIIELANDPEANIDQIADVLSIDPATTAKILRIANSPMYSTRRKSENLRQALLVLGLNATISLALSFSLLKSLQSDQEQTGLDYAYFWRRALLSATASRVLADVVGIKESEEVFLASLMQDIGVIALDAALPELYEQLGDRQTSEVDMSDYERDAIGCDHADVGGWLLERWSFPERLQIAVATSHKADEIALTDPKGAFTRCVSLASKLGEVFLNGVNEQNIEHLADRAQELLGIEREVLAELVERVGLTIPDAESVFQMDILTAEEAEATLAEARDALMMRNLMALQQVENLEDKAETLAGRTKELEESAQRDSLTGLFNRGYLDKTLEEAFADSNKTSAPLSVAFADLDKFKSINDTYGHGAGDEILVATANILRANVRGSDVVARYGGEEFILVFPETDFILVKTICERIVKSFQSTRHDIAGGADSLAVTISMGMATHNDGRVFESPLALVTAADKALYSAKLHGRNRSVAFELVAAEAAQAS